MALYPRRITSTATTIQVVNNDGTTFLTSPTAYKGNETFTALATIRNAISSSGGWSQITTCATGTTKVADYLPSAAFLNANYAPTNVIRGGEYPVHIGTVWGSAAFTGYGWFIGCEGGHGAYWGNDLYLVRLADPIGVYRLYNPSTIGAVSYRSGSLGYPQYTLVPPAQWSLLDPTGGPEECFPSWGPRSTHTYSGMAWDAATELVIFGGSNSNVCMNPTAIGSLADSRLHLWTFNINAATPRSAWQSYPMQNGPGLALAFVRNANGTYGMRDGFNFASHNWNFNPTTRTLISGLAGAPAPITDVYATWRPCFRDESTNKYYEINQQTIGIGYQQPGADQMAIYDVSAGNYSTKICNLPSTYRGSYDVDDHGGIVCMNGYAYIWCMQATVFRVNLATGAIDTYTDGTSIPQPGGGYNGVFGRWGWVPQAQCFVGIGMGTDNVWVFRPPSSWGI